MTRPPTETGTSDPYLEVEGLVKRYGWKTALAGVSFAVYPGECFLVLGPNGAGKSTLLRLLAGVVRPSAGRIAWFGRDAMPVPLDVRARLGVVMHRTMLDPELSVQENLHYFARLYRVSEAASRIREVVVLLGIEERLHERVRQLSRGYQQRVALARALLHRPSVLLLDEPDTGLDQASRRRLVALVREHCAHGGAVIMTTHAQELGIEVATKAVYLERGRVLWSARDAGELREALAGSASLVAV
ncbi:MAG: heme ABC exporter ATP-binding protein CcmA [Thermomicrobium sp.]|nr:heme ABC exporter ATP-binding protein CcmA [Thermomicrobium sp.]MDW8058522.1 heme ABC exporter ATP-binding protein CcmA [Thermomicrobium sp.]